MSGIVLNKLFLHKNIIASDKDASRVRHIINHLKVNAISDNKKAVTGSDIVVLCVKPQFMGQVIGEIQDYLHVKQLVISIAAGISLQYLESHFKGVPVIRVMPNNPCLIGAGISAIAKGKNATASDLKLVDMIFSAIGKTIMMDEKYFDAVTAISGSGPAFVYEYIDAMIEAGSKEGLSKQAVEELVLQTFLGSIKTVLESDKTPVELRNMVTSPGGTTREGLNVLDEAKFRSIIYDTVHAAKVRSSELRKEFEK